MKIKEGSQLPKSVIKSVIKISYFITFILVIAHCMRTVEAADKIVVLSEGRVAEEGSPEELFIREDSMFRRMAQLQNAGSEWSI